MNGFSLFGLLAITVLLAALAGAAAAFAVRRGRHEPAGETALALAIAELRAQLGHVAEAQGELRRDVRGSGETSLRELADVSRTLHTEIGSARRSLAELQTLEAERARQAEHAAQSLRRLEAVVAGSASRGAAGENILARSLAQLPPDLLEADVAFGSRVVEYALRLPDGRWVPIDSKWPSAAGLERMAQTDDPDERQRLADQVGREVRSRARELARYLDPERTLRLGLVAVPDAVFLAAPEAHAAGYRDGVMIVPYSLVLPYLLALYRLYARVAPARAVGPDLREAAEALRRAEEETEGRLSRALVQLGNARDALRQHLAASSRVLCRSLDGSGPSPGEAILAARADADQPLD